ncbi:acetyltransferase [Dysgonomonas sp. OttesenSCG-928-M03]|nr:acetyltransferase [Dysgonomonas sp. OttesenSCG-928-M03]
MKDKLILVGGGGHCKSVIDVAEKAGFFIIGVLDVPENLGKSILDYKVIGTDDDIPNYVDEVLFIVTVGQIKDSTLRIRIHDRIMSAGGRLATIISPTAQISKYASIDEGTVILHQAAINADTKIGKGCIINTFANIEHDSIVGNYTHISTGAMVNGDCKIGESVFVGSQSVLSQGVSVADNSVISAATFVSKSIKSAGIYAGNPVRKIK